MKAHEHRALGDEASGAARVSLGGRSGAERLTLSFGDVVALSADYFFPTDEAPMEGSSGGPEVLASGGLFHLVTVPGMLGTAPGTRDEVIVALRVMAADQGLVDARFQPGGEFGYLAVSPTAAVSEVEQRVRDRFLALGASNDDHFVAPGARGRATEGDRAAPRFGSAPAGYRRLHQLALDEAHRIGRTGGDMADAMAREAAAQHYLTDAFAAGHLRTPVAAIREYWQARYPDFWEGLQRKVAADTARALRDIARPLRLLPSRTLHNRTLATVRARTAGYPRVSFGDLLAKAYHDWDNTHGLAVDGGGMLFGDGCLDQGVTRRRAVAACRAGIDDVEVAHRLGAGGRDLAGEALYAAVRDATGAPGDAFVAEASIPRPSDENPPQNWRAADAESLWESPIVGTSGITVGEAVAEALRPGEELPRRLESVGRGMSGALDIPPLPGAREWLTRQAGEAFQRGFLHNLMTDPRACVLEIVGPPAIG